MFLIDTGWCSAGLVGDVWCGVVFGFPWEFDVEQVGASTEQQHSQRIYGCAGRNNLVCSVLPSSLTSWCDSL